jgi:hypothetical protein
MRCVYVVGVHSCVGSGPHSTFFLMFWGYIATFTNVLTIYHSWTHPLRHSHLSFPPPIPGMVSAGLIFPFTYMCTQNLHHILPRDLSVPSPDWYQPELLKSVLILSYSRYFAWLKHFTVTNVPCYLVNCKKKALSFGEASKFVQTSSFLLANKLLVFPQNKHCATWDMGRYK